MIIKIHAGDKYYFIFQGVTFTNGSEYPKTNLQHEVDIVRQDSRLRALRIQPSVVRLMFITGN